MYFIVRHIKFSLLMSLRDNYHLDIYNLEENLLALALK